jgi:hypothetical protein
MCCHVVWHGVLCVMVWCVLSCGAFGLCDFCHVLSCGVVWCVVSCVERKEREERDERKERKEREGREESKPGL